MILKGCIGGSNVEENAIFSNFWLLLGLKEGFSLLPGIVLGGITIGGGVGVTNIEADCL